MLVRQRYPFMEPLLARRRSKVGDLKLENEISISYLYTEGTLEKRTGGAHWHQHRPWMLPARSRDQSDLTMEALEPAKLAGKLTASAFDVHCKSQRLGCAPRLSESRIA